MCCNKCRHGMQVRGKAEELGELEERYWHDFNDFQIQLRAHVDERDVLLRKVCEPSPVTLFSALRPLLAGTLLPLPLPRTVNYVHGSDG